jgi:hypothetical protein
VGAGAAAAVQHLIVDSAEAMPSWCTLGAAKVDFYQQLFSESIVRIGLSLFFR